MSRFREFRQCAADHQSEEECDDEADVLDAMLDEDSPEDDNLFDRPNLTFNPDKHDYYDDRRAAEILQWQQQHDWMGGEHTLRLERIHPANDKDGNRLRGFVESWRHPVSLEEIRAAHGGGEYMFLIRGPSPDKPAVKDTYLGGQAFVIRGNIIVPKQRAKDELQLPNPASLPDKPPPPTQRGRDLPSQEEFVASGDADIVFGSEVVDVDDVIPAAPLITPADEPDDFK